MARRTADLSEYVHAVIFVVDANDPHLMDGKYRDKLQTIRERLSQEGNVDCYPNCAIHVTTFLLTSYAYATI